MPFSSARYWLTSSRRAWQRAETAHEECFNLSIDPQISFSQTITLWSPVRLLQ